MIVIAWIILVLAGLALGGGFIYLCVTDSTFREVIGGTVLVMALITAVIASFVYVLGYYSKEKPAEAPCTCGVSK